MLLGAFRPPKPDNRVCCDKHLMVTGTSFHALFLMLHDRSDTNVKRACMAADVDAGQNKMLASKLLVFGPREKPWRARWSKSSEQHE